ncbi:MAG: tetratricopeptide repeat protein (plasmid) [Leptolyngbya sp. BL-A-14]
MRPPSLLLHVATVTLLFTLTPYTPYPTPVALAQTLQNHKVEADRLLQQGREQYQTNQLKAALQSWEQALALYRELHDRVGEGKILSNLGAVYDDLGNRDKAIAFLQQSLVVTRASKDQATESCALSNLGAIYRELGDYTKAISYQQQSLAIARQIKNRSIEQKTLFSLGDAYFVAENLPKAIEAYQQSVVIARELKDLVQLETLYLNLGLVYKNLGDYTKAIAYQQQALTIAQNLKDRITEEKAVNNLGTFYEETGEYAKAIDYLQQSLTIVRALHDRKGEGQTLSNLGNVYTNLADYPKAITYHQQALAIAQAIKDRADEFGALGNLGIVYDNLGNYPKAIEYKQQALAITQQMQDRRGMEKALDNLGNTYENLGDYPQAISYHQQGLNVARELHDRRSEGAALGNLGNAYRELGDYAKAIDYHQQSLAIARAINDRKGEENALSNVGVVYYTLGDYAKAIDYERQSLTLAKTIKDRQGEANSFGNLSNTYAALGDYPRSLYYQQQFLAIARAIQDRRGEGAALGNLGSIYNSLGNYTKAVDYLQQSLAVAQAIKNRSGEESVLINLGDVYDTLQNYPKAIAAQQQALAIARELKDREGESGALNNLGLVYYSLKDYPKAIELQQQALAIARELKTRKGEGNALNNLGLALERLGKLPEAERTFLNAIQAWESLRAGLGTNDGYKVSIFEAQARSYRSLQKVLVAQNKPDAALEIAERGRARALVELLAKRAADSKPEVTDKTIHPSVSSVPPSVAQIQQTAKAQDITLVEYSIIHDDFNLEGKQQSHESALYIWVIPPNGQITFRSVDLKPLWQKQNIWLADLVENSRKGIGVSDRGDRSPSLKIVLTPEYLRQLHAQQSRDLKQLHHLLIEPIADLLPTDATAHVIFMPQGSLFLVPFAALQDKSDQYLIQQHTISIAPAIQVLGLTHQQQKAVRSRESGIRNVLVAGNPIMPQVTVPGADAPLYLPDLPGAKQEAIAVAKTLKTTALTGKQAAKHAIVQQMQTARIIHLATHGLLDDFKGLGVPGAIALAPDGNGQPNDGLLTSDDILGMKLNAELVVLSACNTGRGNLTGDGVIGLSRSLISAGVPSVMVSLWSVPDAPTAALMTDFYTTLQHTLDKAQALRQAMLNTMKTHPEPRDWAAFTLIGEAQ